MFQKKNNRCRYFVNTLIKSLFFLQKKVDFKIDSWEKKMK